MTDRFKGFIVTLGEDVREDDAQAIVQALALIKGVVDVRPVVAHINDEINRQRVRRELVGRLWAALEDKASTAPG